MKRLLQLAALLILAAALAGCYECDPVEPPSSGGGGGEPCDLCDEPIQRI